MHLGLRGCSMSLSENNSGVPRFPGRQLHHPWRLNTILQQLSPSKPTTIKTNRTCLIPGSLPGYMFDPVLDTQEILKQPSHQIHLFVGFMVARYVVARSDTSLQYVISLSKTDRFSASTCSQTGATCKTATPATLGIGNSGDTEQTNGPSVSHLGYRHRA